MLSNLGTGTEVAQMNTSTEHIMGQYYPPSQKGPEPTSLKKLSQWLYLFIYFKSSQWIHPESSRSSNSKLWVPEIRIVQKYCSCF